MDFCLRVVRPYWNGKDLTGQLWPAYAIDDLHCNHLPSDVKLIWECNFLKATRKKKDLDICSTYLFCLIGLTEDDKTACNMEEKKDSVCFRTDLL